MGLIKKTVYTGVLTGAGLLGYLGLTTSLTCPLNRDDPLWRSRVYAKHNKYANPSTQDIVTKTIPLSKIKPELLQREGDLVVEFCRGVWSGWGEYCSQPVGGADSHFATDGWASERARERIGLTPGY